LNSGKAHELRAGRQNVVWITRFGDQLNRDVLFAGRVVPFERAMLVSVLLVVVAMAS
jgi:hypothetical protein